MTDPVQPSAAPPPPAPGRRGRWFWLWQLLPPLLLLYLLNTDNGPGYWFTMAPLLVIAMVCVLSVLLRLGFLLLRRGDPRRLVRPLLTLALVFAMVWYSQFARHDAAIVAGVEAHRLQAECERAGRCPDAISIGRGDDGRRRWISTPRTHLTWPLLYLPGDDGGFELLLQEGLDSEMRWTGGPGRELRREAVADGHPTPLPLDP